MKRNSQEVAHFVDIVSDKVSAEELTRELQNSSDVTEREVASVGSNRLVGAVASSDCHVCASIIDSKTGYFIAPAITEKDWGMSYKFFMGGDAIPQFLQGLPTLVWRHLREMIFFVKSDLTLSTLEIMTELEQQEEKTTEPILSSGVRILRPREYELIREAIKTEDNRTKLDALLLTGLRYSEAQRFQERMEWFDGNSIHLPEMVTINSRRKQKERWVRLSPRCIAALTHLFEARKLPSWRGWTLNLKRWAVTAGIDPIGLSPKTTRKTLEGWLIFFYDNPGCVLHLLASQGYTDTSHLKRCMNLPFTAQDKSEMTAWIGGWDR